MYYFERYWTLSIYIYIYFSGWLPCFWNETLHSVVFFFLLLFIPNVWACRFSIEEWWTKRARVCRHPGSTVSVCHPPVAAIVLVCSRGVFPHVCKRAAVSSSDAIVYRRVTIVEVDLWTKQVRFISLGPRLHDNVSSENASFLPFQVWKVSHLTQQDFESDVCLHGNGENAEEDVVLLSGLMGGFFFFFFLGG